MKNITSLLITFTLTLLPQLAHSQEPLAPPQVIGSLNTLSDARLMNPLLLDINDDNYADIIIPAPGNSVQGNNNTGSIYIIFGKENFPFTDIDLSKNTHYDTRIDGINPNDQFAYNIQKADINGDGITDLAISSPGNNGALYILFGDKNFPKQNLQINDKKLKTLTFYTNKPNTYMATTICLADLNNDQMDDIIWTSIDSTPQSHNTSFVHIIPSRSTWQKNTHSLSEKIPGKITLYRNLPKSLKLPHTCATADFNDDGSTDLALGMPLDNGFDNENDAGSVTIIYNPIALDSTPKPINKLKQQSAITIYGDQPGARFGQSLAASDFNHDGLADLIVAAPNRLINGPQPEGTIYLFKAQNLPKTNQPQKPDASIIGTGGSFASNLQTIDINNDKRPDLAIAHPYASPYIGHNNGAIHFLIASPLFFEHFQNPIFKPDLSIYGKDFMHLGFAASIADINKDLNPDLIIRTASKPQNPKAGSLILIPNIKSLDKMNFLNDLKHATINAPKRDAQLSPLTKKITLNGSTYTAWLAHQNDQKSSICLINDQYPKNIYNIAANDCDYIIHGPQNHEINSFDIDDFNNDNTPDLAISLPTLPLPQKQDKIGLILITPLTFNNTNTITISTTDLPPNTWIFHTADNTQNFAAKLQIKDLNNDKYTDLIASAPSDDTLFIFKNSPEFIPKTYELNENNAILIKAAENENFGEDFYITDFNNDKAQDLLILAPKAYDTKNRKHPRASLIFNPSTWNNGTYNIFDTTLNITTHFYAPSHTSGLKIIHNINDLNNDNNNEIALFAPNFRPGLQRQGAIYIFNSTDTQPKSKIELSKHHATSYTILPQRNEKIIDFAITFHPNDPKQFLALLSTTALNNNHTNNIFFTKSEKPNTCLNDFNAPDTRSKLKIPKSNKTTFITFPEPWLLHPHATPFEQRQAQAYPVPLP